MQTKLLRNGDRASERKIGNGYVKAARSFQAKAAVC